MKKIFKLYLPIIIVLIIIALLFQPNPYLRNAFRYYKAGINDVEIFENRVIKTGNSTEWKVSENYNQYIFSQQDSLLHRKNESVAFVVIKDSLLVYESYWDGYSSESQSSSFSLAKSIVSLLIGAAINDSLIESVNDPVSKYIPEFMDNRYKITIKDLLTMSSGLKWEESYSNPFSVTTKAYYGKNVNKLVLKAKAALEPATKFEYITANPQILSIIIKRVTGKTLSEYASEKLWQPIGAVNEASWSLDEENGDEKAYCCFNSNARDFARIGQLILNKGSWNEVQLIPENYLKESFSPANHLVDKDNKAVDFYGYQWWLSKHIDMNIYYARGILGQYIICVPDKNMVIVRLGHKRDSRKINHHPADLYEYINLGLKICK